MSLIRDPFGRKNAGLFAVLFLFWLLITTQYSQAQEVDSTLRNVEATPAKVDEAGHQPTANSAFRIEKIRVDGGAELLTIFGRLQNTSGLTADKTTEMPLISVLRDTLGDTKPENDRLRYVWNLYYSKTSFGQKISAFVPFLYTRTTNKKTVGTSPPPPIFDMTPNDNGPWNKIFGVVFKKIVLAKVGTVVRAPIFQYQQNIADYRRAAIAKSLAVFSLYQPTHRETLLRESELKDIQARLWLTDKTFGGHMQSENLTRVFDKEIFKTRDVRNQNWELLRQYSERQGLYFDPLTMPDGSTRHAILWADAADIQTNANKKFDSRFLNIKNPWKDTKLTNWNGYSQTRWFDDDERQVTPDTGGAESRKMIPLAVYGLDFPKIPTLLVDFRDNGNVKRREMSKRVLTDLTSNVLQLGQFSSLPYFFGRHGYDYFTGRRGMDINQSSRLRSYAQLKLLLSLDTTLDKNFKDEIANRLESASLNPLENDLDAEAKLARSQYENLTAYAKRPDGLRKQIDNDRRQEMVGLVHSSKQRLFFSLGHFFSFGRYTHREKSTPELVARMDIRRQLDHHERFLREVAYNSAKPEIDSDVEALKRSLQFVSENGAAAKEKTTRALGKIFMITDDEEMRRLSLAGLYRINNSAAKKQLLAIYENSKVTEKWRNLCEHYLKLALDEGQQISSRDARAISGIEVN
ncbi:MAG: hypothetical protein ACKVRN_09955 [Pyrinomonadaceae bacterium]